MSEIDALTVSMTRTPTDAKALKHRSRTRGRLSGGYMEGTKDRCAAVNPKP